jgi:hypothetical protein
MAFGAIVLLIVIFSTGWVVTSNTANAQARATAGEAVLERLVPISIAQFNLDPNGRDRLEELKKLDSWKRGDFVVEQGWATMPGETEPDRGVAMETAKRLMELKN